MEDLPECKHMITVVAKVESSLRDGVDMEVDAVLYPGMVTPESRCAFNRYIATIPPGEVAMGRRGVAYWEKNFMPKFY